MEKLRSLFFLILTVLMIASCMTSKPMVQRSENSLNKVWDNLDILSQVHTGLAVYDLDNGNWIFNYRDDNYFTPASCTKLLTMYTTLRYLDDRIPAAYYKVKGDTMIVWGGADPGTLFPDIHASSPLIDFLKSTDKKIIFSSAPFSAKHYGAGWAWDDYTYNFQSDRTDFPLYGNKLWIERKHDTITVTPKYLKQVLTIKKDTIEYKGRNEWGSNYFYHFDPAVIDTTLSIPISFFENDEKLIWSEVLGKDVITKNIPFSGNALEITGSDRDTLLKVMMQESDNFIAEQLLLACSMKEMDHMNENDIIGKLITGPLLELPDSIHWVDGSGLSRYNLVTPRSLIWVLRQIIKQENLDYVKSIFPAGGQSGTIKTDFTGFNGQPYIFAKSGSLRNTYCLTGLLVTKSGHTLLFSWLNNDFWGSNTKLKQAMEHMFIYLRDNY